MPPTAITVRMLSLKPIAVRMNLSFRTAMLIYFSLRLCERRISRCFNYQTERAHLTRARICLHHICSHRINIPSIGAVKRGQVAPIIVDVYRGGIRRQPHAVDCCRRVVAERPPRTLQLPRRPRFSCLVLLSVRNDRAGNQAVTQVNVVRFQNDLRRSDFGESN